MEAVGLSPAFWHARRVFLTGHTGFKGAWASLMLARLGAEVTGYALDPPTDPSLYGNAAGSACAREHHADVRDLPSLVAALAEARPSVVIHMAAQSLVRRSYRDPVETYGSNVMGTVHLLEAVRACACVEATLVVTSDKCYENREHGEAYRESDPMGGHDPYSSSKGCAELVTSAWRRSYFDGAGLASVRAGNVIGGGDWAEDRLVPDAMRAFARGETVAIRNPGAVRPWQHVLEPLCGYLLLAERPARYARGFNFGPDPADARAVGPVVEHLARAWGGGASWKSTAPEEPLHEAGLLTLDSALARHELGWTPRLPLDEGLDWTVAWYRAHAGGEDMTRFTLGQIEAYLDA